MFERRQGFTLVEMAIVLTIIALLIGGVVVGGTLIHNAQLQSVINDEDRYKKATMLFKEKYQYLPGDMPTAETFWGSDASCPNTPANITLKTATCNGNGDGFIGGGGSPPFGIAPNYLENYRVWQHLANAGFIEGAYTGAQSSTTGEHQVGISQPLSKIAGNSFTLSYAIPGADPGGAFAANYRHILVYGQPGGGDGPNMGPGLTTGDALLIDQKLDDGMPGMGNVLSYTPSMGATPNCATSTDEKTAQYNMAATGSQCSLIFITGF